LICSFKCTVVTFSLLSITILIKPFRYIHRPFINNTIERRNIIIWNKYMVILSLFNEWVPFMTFSWHRSSSGHWSCLCRKQIFFYDICMSIGVKQILISKCLEWKRVWNTRSKTHKRRVACSVSYIFYISMKSCNIYEIIISIEFIRQIPYNHDRYNLYNISFLLISILLYVRV